MVGVSGSCPPHGLWPWASLSMGFSGWKALPGGAIHFSRRCPLLQVSSNAGSSSAGTRKQEAPRGRRSRFKGHGQTRWEQSAPSVRPGVAEQYCPAARRRAKATTLSLRPGLEARQKCRPGQAACSGHGSRGSGEAGRGSQGKSMEKEQRRAWDWAPRGLCGPGTGQQLPDQLLPGSVRAVPPHFGGPVCLC